jgi:hypothetical protein
LKELDSIKSTSEINEKQFLTDLSIMARDILEGKNNSLGPISK